LDVDIHSVVLHVVSAVHTRLEVLLLGVDSNWLAKSHVASAVHTRS